MGTSRDTEDGDPLAEDEVPLAEGGDPQAEAGDPRVEDEGPGAEGGDPQTEDGVPRAEEDGPWKSGLRRYFNGALKLFVLELHDLIDWSVEPVFHDKELQRLFPDSEAKGRIADLLVQVRLLSGPDAWVYFHVEVQGAPDVDFEERSFICFYRIYDRYRQQVVTLAILTDDVDRWRPDRFEMNVAGCRAEYRFLTVKLSDWRARTDELEASDNPFAPFVQAQVASRDTVGQPEGRLREKIRLVRSLHRRGLRGDDIREVSRLIDWLMGLPPALERTFLDDMHDYAEETKMDAYIPSWERIGREDGLKAGRLEGRQEGRQEGQLQGRQTALLDLLLERFGEESPEIADRIRRIQDGNQIRPLIGAALSVDSLEEFARRLPSDA